MVHFLVSTSLTNKNKRVFGLYPDEQSTEAAIVNDATIFHGGICDILFRYTIEYGTNKMLQNLRLYEWYDSKWVEFKSDELVKDIQTIFSVMTGEPDGSSNKG